MTEKQEEMLRDLLMENHNIVYDSDSIYFAEKLCEEAANVKTGVDAKILRQAAKILNEL